VLGHLGPAREFPEVPDLVDDRLAVVERNARRLDALVEDLLDVARQQEGCLSVTMTECDLADVVRQAVEAVRPAAGHSGLDVAVAGCGGVRAVIDSRRM